MTLKQNIFKIITLSSIIGSVQLFGTQLAPELSTSTQTTPHVVSQQSIVQPIAQENSDEYSFKKKFREIYNSSPFGYYVLMWFYAGLNGAASEGAKNGCITSLPNQGAPLALEVIDFIGNEIEDKNKDTFEWFFENSNRLGFLIKTLGGFIAAETTYSLDKNKAIAASKQTSLQLINFLDTDLAEFQNGAGSAARNVVKTILRGIIPALINKGEPHAGCAFEPLYPLLFDGIVTQLPEEAKDTKNKKRAIRAARGLIRAAVRTAIY